jgi:hypothetical protein
LKHIGTEQNPELRKKKEMFSMYRKSSSFFKYELFYESHWGSSMSDDPKATIHHHTNTAHISRPWDRKSRRSMYPGADQTTNWASCARLGYRSLKNGTNMTNTCIKTKQNRDLVGYVFYVTNNKRAVCPKLQL